MITKKSPKPIDQHVGARVRARRQMLGMSQENLGDGLGLTFQQVQKYEKGTNRIGASRLQQIAQILQVPPAFFFEDGPKIQSVTRKGNAAEPPGPIFEFLSTSDGESLSKGFMRIKDQHLRRSIVIMVEKIAARNNG